MRAQGECSFIVVCSCRFVSGRDCGASLGEVQVRALYVNRRQRSGGRFGRRRCRAARRTTVGVSGAERGRESRPGSGKSQAAQTRLKFVHFVVWDIPEAMFQSYKIALSWRAGSPIRAVIKH